MPNFRVATSIWIPTPLVVNYCTRDIETGDALQGRANYAFGYSQLLKNIDTFGITVIMIGDTRQIEKNMPRGLGKPLTSGFKMAPLANTIGYTTSTPTTTCFQNGGFG